VHLSKPAFLEGIVLQAGTRKPVANARVRGWSTATHVELLRGATNEAGHFRFSGIMPVGMTLEVLPRDAQSPRWQRLELIAGRNLRCDLTVEAGATLRGVVKDARTGKPIAAAEISDSWTFKRLVRTDTAGRYELRGREYDEIYVRASGYGKQGLRLGDDDELNVALEPGRRVSGRIVDTKGKPVASVYVAVVGTERIANQQQTDWEALFTDVDGRFSYASVRRDIPHCLLVRADGFGTLVYDFPENENKRESIDFGSITLPEAVYLGGRVLDERGLPILGTPVTLSGTNADRYRFLARPAGVDPREPRGSFYINIRKTMTDSLGRYHFADLAPGNYRVKARVEEVTPRVVRSSIIESETTVVRLDGTKPSLRHDFAIKLGRTLRGRMMTPSGQVPPQAQITVQVDGEDSGHKPMYLRPGLPFRLFQLPPGRLAITAWPCTRAGMPIVDPKTIRAGTRRGVFSAEGITWICYSEPAWVQAFVQDKTGQPVTGVRVVATDATGREVAGRSTDHRGSVSLHVGDGTTVRLVAHVPRGVLGGVTRGPEVPAGTSNVVIEVGR
ncbi:MAG: hypothetical protein V3U11_13175, partial [Planctomycetota bacterium]